MTLGVGERSVFSNARYLGFRITEWVSKVNNRISNGANDSFETYVPVCQCIDECREVLWCRGVVVSAQNTLQYIARYHQKHIRYSVFPSVGS